MDNQKRYGIVLAWLVIFCLFLLLGTIYLYAPQRIGDVEPYFPLFGGLTSRVEEAAGEMGNGKAIGEAVVDCFLRSGLHEEKNTN